MRQLPWTHNLIILTQSKSAEEQAFYIRQTIKEKWSKRELEQQFKSCLFQRTVLSPVKATQSHPDVINLFKDAIKNGKNLQ